MRFPNVTEVAKSLRAFSAASPVSAPVRLLVSPLDGAWEVAHAGASHDPETAFQATAVVPGQNAQGKPYRFNSTDMAKAMVADIRTQTTARITLPANPQTLHKRRTRRSATPPPMESRMFDVGTQVTWLGQTGKVIGHAIVQTPTGPKKVHLVECVVAVEDHMLREVKAAPKRRKASTTRKLKPAVQVPTPQSVPIPPINPLAAGTVRPGVSP
jgi:hypothetical protein